MNVIEVPVAVAASGVVRIGVVTRAARTADKAVLIVPAPTETRTGPERLYVRLARELARNGLPSLRLDASDGGDCQPDDRGRIEFYDNGLAAARQLLALHPDSYVALLAVGRAAIGAARAWQGLARAGVPLSALCLVDPTIGLRAAEGKVRWWRRHFDRPARAAGAPHNAGSGDTFAADSNEALWTALPPAVRAARARLLVVARELVELDDGLSALAGSDRAWRKTLGRTQTCLELEGADAGFTRPADWRKLTDWLATQLTR